MTVQDWLDNNEIGVDMWTKKYKNETFDDWIKRVSGNNGELAELILYKIFLFGGRTLANRGTNKKGSYSNCYCSGKVKDDIDDLMEVGHNIALTYKAQGGQGISFSDIRPAGCGINNGQFESDGIIPFLKIYDQITASISQGGSRKGALIASVDIWHKDSIDFIDAKSKIGELEKTNLSLEIDNEFMEAVKKYYKSGATVCKHIVREYNGNKIEYDITPIELYKLMMKRAYDWAEPGCIFIDRFKNYNLMEFDEDYQIEGCNPCGEQPLPKHGACNLGSINISKFVKRPFEKNAVFDYEGFTDAIYTAVEALDCVLDENLDNHPLKEQREMAYNYRNIGLGIMGLADMFIKMRLVYGSSKSKRVLNDIMYRMFRAAVLKSSELAKVKGSFPKYNECVFDSSIIKQHFNAEEIKKLKKNGLRNCSLLSIAPTGTIANMINASNGCEPLFEITYKRKTENLNNGKEKYYDMTAGVALEYKNKFKTNKLPYYFVTASDIKWKDRIDIQSILQNHVDTGISSTVNLPQKTTLEEVEQLYLYAWEKGLKGVTIYRNGGMREGIISTEEKTQNLKSSKQLNETTPITRDELGHRLNGGTYVKRIACGKLYITINRDDNDNLVEVFIDSGKSGGCSANAECLGRFASAAMRNGMAIDSIVDITKGVKCSACTNMKGKAKQIDGLSCGDVLARTIQEEYEHYHTKKQKEHKKNTEQQVNALCDVFSKTTCPDCGNKNLNNEGGCIVCHNCGWSKCD